MQATTSQSETLGGLSCESCGASLNVEAGERTAMCPYCASPAVVAKPRAAGEDPAFVVGFVIPEADARTRARAWIQSTWFVKSAFAKADVSAVRGVYLPAYLYSGSAAVEYTAQIGENYTVTETYTTTDSQGKTVTRTRTRTVTEWRSLQGSWAAYLDDVVVTASRGLENAELEAIEPYDLRALHRYTPKLLSGWLAEDPSRSVAECAAMARQEAVEQVGRRVSAHMPGDSHRSLQYKTRFENEHGALMLLPVWVLAVKYDPEAPAVRMVLNGQTGALIGKPPRSWVKISLAVVVGIVLIAAVVALAGANP
ncbi:MAG: hypothetical protein ACRBN8_13070 [Nannocystales bacterium]